MENKRGIITEYLPWLIIGLAVLAIVLIGIMTMNDTGNSFIDKFKNIIRGG